MIGGLRGALGEYPVITEGRRYRSMDVGMMRGGAGEVVMETIVGMVVGDVRGIRRRGWGAELSRGCCLMREEVVIWHGRMDRMIQVGGGRRKTRRGRG
jgi:hypothetical protein